MVGVVDLELFWAVPALLKHGIPLESASNITHFNFVGMAVGSDQSGSFLAIPVFPLVPNGGDVAAEFRVTPASTQ